MSERYYPADCVFFPSGKSELIMRNRNSGEVHKVSRLEAELFGLLGGCMVRSGFLAQLELTNRHRLSSSSLDSAVQRWIGNGMLRPAGLLEQKRKVKKESSGGGDLICAVFTGRRPESLSTWLSGRTASPHFSDRKLKIMVFDDGRDAAVRERNRKICASAAEGYTGTIIYSGPEARIKLRDQLARRAAEIGADPTLPDFALFGPRDAQGLTAPGANRNMTLLLSGGKNLLLSDDDLYYRFRAPVGAGGGKTRFSVEHHSPVCFYPSMEALETETMTLPDYDLPGKVMEYLGASLNPEWNMDDLSARTARRMEAGGACIGAVCAGYAGARWYDFSRYPAIRRQWSDGEVYLDEKQYRQVIDNGINIIAAAEISVYEGDFLQAGTLALSGTLTIPPFFPVGIHEDPAFGTLLKYCNDTSFFCHLPAALFHDPSCKQPFVKNTQRFAIDPGKLNLLITREVAPSLYGTYGTGRLLEAGRKYRERAALSRSSFDEYCVSLAGRHCRRMITHIDRQLEIFGAEPGWWAEDLRSYKKELESAAENPLSAIPEGFRNWIGMYGQLLDIWPELMNAYAS